MKKSFLTAFYRARHICIKDINKPILLTTLYDNALLHGCNPNSRPNGVNSCDAYAKHMARLNSEHIERMMLDVMKPG